ncbi:MAG: hypothetical protein UT86_C0003G0116 [Candidatus Magasanikbacteria bacterium GW2011_GWC2_40_17]|uniref:Uncharacterized protein n=1 Tax=Candidatus Magasanikbacteria bacterium GW2011_GWA2_42_32 TaxID=1619039 RepID=A0A0G1A7V3_9BACT|nr:MAG: hypothetical protein UT86_C0003G0116 [Candidatus Magasanikbacteria bacterium GW2011_GWC2_40_17]KKS57019.1 MAG: hypothetical protein UV20_C0004G0115 [Candidatus Magasanikbacteria bacterium GW2011_GWA2_42_32]
MLDNYDELIKKVNKLKEEGEVDLSVEEDLSIAIMNLISLEEHFFFTAEKTGKDEYFNLLETIREMRKQLLGMMIKQTEGEVWCISKHLLAASMRLMEVGTKMQSRKQLDSAKDMFKKSYELFSLFFAIRLKLVDLPDIKRENLDENNLDKPWTKDKIMTELLDCCKE